MTRFDFSPLFRSTVGFDRLMRLLEDSNQWAESNSSYPPYNIEKTSEDHYRITLAVAGFRAEDLSIMFQENAIVVEGQRQEPENTGALLYRGIAGRSFKRQFQLADHVRVVGAALDNGLLTIELVREVPEALKPRRITISAGKPDSIEAPENKLLEGDKVAA